MATAKIGVRGPSGGAIQVNLTYSYWSDNTWTCASKGVMGATSGTWDIGRDIAGLGGAGSISLYSGDDLIAAGDGFAYPDLVGYPFNDDFLNRTSTFRFYRRESRWYYGAYMLLGLEEELLCSWWVKSF